MGRPARGFVERAQRIAVLVEVADGGFLHLVFTPRWGPWGSLPGFAVDEIELAMVFFGEKDVGGALAWAAPVKLRRHDGRGTIGHLVGAIGVLRQHRVLD